MKRSIPFVALSAAALFAQSASADQGGTSCAELPSHAALKAALTAVVAGGSHPKRTMPKSNTTGNTATRRFIFASTM